MMSFFKGAEVPKKLELPVEELTRLYNEGSSANVIATRYGVSRVTIVDRLRKAGVTIRTPKECNRKYSLKHDCFDGELTEDKAYWIGFVAADGSVSDRKRMSRGVSVVQKDKEHLEKLRLFYQTERPIFKNDSPAHVVNGRQIKATSLWALEVLSDQIATTLLTYGIGPRKSHTVIACNGIERNKHYWRGLVDGNGSVLIRRDRKIYHTPTVELGSGNDKHLQQFNDFIKTSLPDVSVPTICKILHANCWVSVYTGYSAWLVCDLLYRDATVYLDRKYATAIEIVNRFQQLEGRLAVTDSWRSRVG